MRSNAPRRWLALPLACMLALLSISSAALEGKEKPSSYALIAGTVWTTKDRGAPGVTVKIRRSEDPPNRARWELVTNARGEFDQRVPAETAGYVVWVELKGHKGPAAQTTVEIDGDEYRTISLHLTE